MADFCPVSAAEPVLSIVVPVYGAPAIVAPFYERTVKALESWINFEIIMVNDSCPKGSGTEIEKLADIDQRVKYIELSRNCGQSIAISAGLDYAVGKYIVVMDCDLQDQPEEIEKLYRYMLQGGYDAVFGARKLRKDTWLKKITSKCFNFMVNLLTSHEQITRPHSSNFSIVTRRVIEAYKCFSEKGRSYPSIVRYITSNVGYVDIEHAPRFEGKSSYNAFRLIERAATVIIANSNKPLIFSIYLSGGLFLAGAAYGTRLIYLYMKYEYVPPGWTSIMVAICFFFSLQFLLLGILGAYIGSIFTEVKKRPLYAVKKCVNVKNPHFVRRVL